MEEEFGKIVRDAEKNTAAEMGSITKNISVLLELLSELEKRISPALLLQEDLEGADTGVPTPPMCEIAMAIREQGYRIKEATEKVNNMLDRLDI